MTPRLDDNASDALGPIREGRNSTDSQASNLTTEPAVEKQPSLASQLPILVIIQYGLLALHSTTHDQVFLSYLVSYVIFLFAKHLTNCSIRDFEDGGLNLNAGHFAQLGM